MPSTTAADIPNTCAGQPEGSSPASDGFHIPSLDGFRALAFVIVFVSHAGLGDLVPGGFGDVALRGGFG